MPPSNNDTVLPSRLLPRISVRLLLSITFFAALVASTARFANSGAIFAKAALFALASIIAFFAISVLIFFLSRLLDFRRQKEEINPNTVYSDSLPPQILPPRDPNP